MAIKQLIDANGVVWPLYLDTETGNMCGGTATTPVTAFAMQNNKDDEDCRLSVATTSLAGPRAEVSIYGPTNDGFNNHVSLAYGGPVTGLLGSRFGIAMGGQYCAVLAPNLPADFGKQASGARWWGFGDWNSPIESPQAPVHVKGTIIADQFKFWYGGNPIDLYQIIVQLQADIAALSNK